MTFGLGSQPDPSWGANPASSPPSFATGRIPAVGFSTPGGATTVPVGQPTTVHLGVAPAGADGSTVQWNATATGLDVAPASGRLVLRSSAGAVRQGGTSCRTATTLTTPVTEPLTLTATTPGSYVLDIRLQTTGGTALPPVVLDVTATG